MRRLLPLLILSFCSKPVDLKKESDRYDAYVAALPDLKEVAKTAPINLRVRYVEATNLPGLTLEERTKLFRELEAKVREIYGYTLSVTEGRPAKITDFFASVDRRFREFPIAFPAQGFLISYFSADRDARITAAIEATLKSQSKEKIREYLGEIKTAPEGTRSFLQKLDRIYAEKDLAGNAILDRSHASDERYYSYGHWSSLLQAEKDTDFFLTNAGILGADTGMPLYVIARGGVTTALVENNAHSPLQGAGVLGLYPLLADTAFFNEQRGALTREQKIETILWIWLHELGHLLLKKSENYTFADSVHRAAPNLRYYDWVKQIKASRNHHSAEIPAMKKF